MQPTPGEEEEEEEEEEIYVSCLMAGGAAEASGEIEVGDVVLNVMEEDEQHRVLDEHHLRKQEHKTLESIQLRLRGVCVCVCVFVCA